MSSSRELPTPPVPPIPVGLEDLVGMAAASPDFAEELVARRQDAVLASGVALAPTEAAVLEAVDGQTLSRMIETCRAQQANEARRAFLTRASAAMLLLLGAGGLAACEKKSSGTGGKTTTPNHKPALPGKMPAPQMGPAMAAQPDGGTPRARPVPQVSAGVRPPRPRPERPSGVKTGISPEHRRPKKLDVETGSRPD